MQSVFSDLSPVNCDIVKCRKCPRLVAWREAVAHEKVKRFAEQAYWGKAVPNFGDEAGRVLILGLAPAAHGANRTGRMFTGDNSGVWLYRALHKAGFANQPHSDNITDGLQLLDCNITAVAHCAPPANKPLPEEITNCRPYFFETIEAMPNLQVIVALGKIAFDEVIKNISLAEKGPRPKFTHGVETTLQTGLILIGSYHPSQQNTFTGKLTEPMLDEIFEQAKRHLT